MLVHNFEFVCTSHSKFQYAQLTQTAIIYGAFSGLRLVVVNKSSLVVKR